MKKTAVGAAAALLLMALAVFAPAILVTTSSAIAAQQASCTTTGTPATGNWRPPFQQAYTLTSPFGPRPDPVTGAPGFHAGQDLVSLPGPGPVVAAAAGTVTIGADPGGYGTYASVDHGGGVTTVYGHLARLAPGIRTGTTVWTGQQLGVEGSTGHSTGNHLHFEVRENGTAVDPVTFMLAHGAPLNGEAIAPSPRPAPASPTPAGARAASASPSHRRAHPGWTR